MRAGILLSCVLLWLLRAVFSCMDNIGQKWQVWIHVRFRRVKGEGLWTFIHSIQLVTSSYNSLILFYFFQICGAGFQFEGGGGTINYNCQCHAGQISPDRVRCSFGHFQKETLQWRRGVSNDLFECLRACEEWVYFWEHWPCRGSIVCTLETKILMLETWVSRMAKLNTGKTCTR